MSGSISDLNPDEWSADSYAANARFVSEYGEAIIDLLAPRPGEHILDLGCGDGALTTKISGLGATVVAVDASGSMVAAARKLGINAFLKRGEDLAFREEFDAVFSNAALHWMTRPDKVAQNIYQALKPGARFVGEMGGMGNVAAIHTAILAVFARHGLTKETQSPWYFPSVSEYRAVLENAGLTVDQMTLIPRPTPVKAGMTKWLETLAAPYFSRIDPIICTQFRDEIVELLRPALCDQSGNWTVDYVRLRFVAHR